jgi:hypothetical protein
MLILITLFDADGFGQVFGLADTAAAADGDVIGEHLQGDDLEDGQQQLGAWGMEMTSRPAGLCGVTLDGDGDHAAGARGAPASPSHLLSAAPTDGSWKTGVQRLFHGPRFR